MFLVKKFESRLRLDILQGIGSQTSKTLSDLLLVTQKTNELIKLGILPRSGGNDRKATKKNQGQW